MTSPEETAFLERLQREVLQWQREGLLSSQQAESLLARYHLLPGETPSTLRRSRIVLVFAVLGAILVGVGVLLVIGANWEGIPKWTRLALLFVATTAAYGTGYRLAYHSTKHPRLGVALLLLGSLLWGASIFLVGQMYHQGAGEGGERTALGYWFLGVLPLAYALPSLLHLILALLVGTIWVNLSLATLEYPSPGAVAMLFLSLGLALYGLGRLHAPAARVRVLEPAFRWSGLLYAFGGLYAFSFRDLWRRYGAGPGEAAPPVLWAVWGAAALVTVLLLVTSARRSRSAVGESLGLFGLLGINLAFLLLHAAWFSSPWDSFDFSQIRELPLLYLALLNLLLLLASLGLVALGWSRNEPGLASFGLFVFFLHVVTRYFDLLGGLLSSGLMFIGAGILLLVGGAFLERSRRGLLRAMAERSSP